MGKLESLMKNKTYSELNNKEIIDAINDKVDKVTGKSLIDDLAITRLANTSGSNTGDETASTIKTKLGITTLSGSNTGDETASTIKTKLGITTLSGSNTGDETASTIKTKLGITTLSGSNTGDQFVPTKTSEITNDSGFITSSSIPDISGKEDKSNKVTSISENSTHTEYPSAKSVYDNLPQVVEFDGNRFVPTKFWSKNENGYYEDDSGNWVMTIDENGNLFWKDLNIDNVGSEIILNKVISMTNTSTDIQYPSAKAVYDQLILKQPSGSYELTTNKNANNGYAGLDSGGKVGLSQLPSTLLIYKSTWNASTNTPQLTTPDTGKVGWVYTVNGVGTRFGIDWKLGDWLIYNSSGIPEKSDNSDDVTSVNGQQGVVTLTAANVGAEPAFSTASSPQNTYYLRGNKSWAVFASDVRAALLSGLGTLTNVAIIATDSILEAFAKVQGQINNLILNKVDKVSGKSLVSDTEITKLSNISGSNTGDETATSIKTKLGITTLSGSNTGDQFVPTKTSEIENDSDFVTSAQIPDISGKENILNKNQPNGYIGADAGGKVGLAQLPSTLLLYKSTWNALTNDPPLINPDLTKIGFVYTVSTIGTQFGIDWDLGDWLIYNENGIVEISKNSDDVLSVNGEQGIIVLTAVKVGAEPTLTSDTKLPSATSKDGQILSVVNGVPIWSGNILTGLLNTGLQIESTGITEVPLIIQGKVGQTANLQEWQNSTGTIIARIGSDGTLYAKGSILSTAIANPTTGANSLISLNTTGMVISRNINDDKPALIVNQSNASSTGSIQEWQFNSNQKARITVNGNFILTSGASFMGLLTYTSGQNYALVNPTIDGVVISRNTADDKSALTVNQIHASSTGKILDLQFGGVPKASFDKDGILTSSGIIATTTVLNAAGIAGTSSTGIGVRGQSSGGYGLYGQSSGSYGIVGTSISWIGIQGQSTGSMAGTFMQNGTLTSANTYSTFGIGRNGVTNSVGGKTYSGNILDMDDTPSGTGVISGALISGKINTIERFRVEPRVVDSATAVGAFIDTHTNLVTAGAKLLSIRNQGIEKASIDKDGGAYFDGRVGIGTNNPTEKLEVTGNIKASGTITSNGNKVETETPFITVTDGNWDYSLSKNIVLSGVSTLAITNVNSGNCGLIMTSLELTLPVNSRKIKGYDYVTITGSEIYQYSFIYNALTSEFIWSRSVIE